MFFGGEEAWWENSGEGDAPGVDKFGGFAGK